MEVLYSEKEIARRIAEMGREIAPFYAGKPLTLIVLMNGGAFFGADLARAIGQSFWFDSMRTASYIADARGAVRMETEPKLDPRGREILLADDVFDSGNTVEFCRKYLLERGALGVRCAVLIDKQVPGRKSRPEWAGFTAPDRYLAGYGMDFCEEYRNLPFVGMV